MKKAVMFTVLFLLLTSLFTFAQADVVEKSSCSGFFGSISCFLWGNPENRAGRGWFEGRRNVVGEAANYDAASRTLTVDGIAYARSDGPLLHQGKYYYIFIAPNSETFIYYNNNWRQIKVVDESGISATLNFLKRDKTVTTNPDEADTSAVLSRYELGDAARLGSPPDGTTEIVKRSNGRDIFIRQTATGKEYYDTSSNSWKVLETDVENSLRAGQGIETLTLRVVASAANPAPATLSLDVSSNLGTIITEGDTIVSTTGAEFKVENGEWVQTKGPRDKPSERLATDVDQEAIDKIILLNNPDNYGQGRRFYKLIPSQQRIEEAKRTLGETVYGQVQNEISWFESRGNNYQLTNSLRSVRVDEQEGRTIVNLQVKQADGRNINKDLSQTVIVTGGQEILSQTYAQKEKGMIKFSGSTGDVYIGQQDIGSGSITYYANEQAFKDKKPMGTQEFKDGVVTNTNFQERSRTIIDTNRHTTEIQEGDSYKKGEGGCDKAPGCFVPTGGTMTIGGETYVMDIDLEGSGATRQIKETELYNPQTGRREGIMEADGTTIIAQRHQEGDRRGEYSGGSIIRSADGRVTTVRKDEQGNWVPTYDNREAQAEQNLGRLGTILGDATTAHDLAVAEENKLRAEVADLETRSVGGENVEQNLKNAQVKLGIVIEEQNEAKTEVDRAREEVNQAKQALTKAQEERDELIKKQAPNLEAAEFTTVGGFAIAQNILSSVYSISQSVKDYPALSKLFGLPTGDDFIFDADQTFAPLLGSNWFPSAICDGSYDIEPEGFAMIKTVSGTYQAVAGIQMERSAATSPILCQRNPDTAAEEQFICDQGYVCVNDGFCFIDAGEDEEPDSEQPAQGYFYKITWGVTAPRDEAFTPLLDENGVAVSFNIWLDKTPDGKAQTDAPNAAFMYVRQGDTHGPIKLNNGAADQDVIIHYSPNLYEEACIKWKQPPSTVDMLDGNSEGRRSEGFFSDFGESMAIVGQEGGPLAPIAAVRNIRGVTGIDDIGDVCFTVDISSVGEVNWERSGQTTPSVTVQSGQVQRNGRW